MEENTCKERCVMLSSSEDDEKQNPMLKIINTISLHGCSSNFSFDQPEVDELILYPKCEVKEENGDEKEEKYFINQKENGNNSNEKMCSGVIKRAKLTSFKLDHFKSSKDDGKIVDASKLALQESLFKAKELFDTFLRVCQDQESSEHMEKVVEKLERAYSRARQDYVGSERFQSMLESETEKVNVASCKPWLNLKLILDELKFNKKGANTKLKLGESDDSQNVRESDEDMPHIECPKKRRHLKKLEKTLRALNLKIKKLEEKEVDLDDEYSAYIKLDRYKDQFTKIYKKVCEIKGKLPDADRPYLRKVSFAGTTYPHINRCIEKYYNKHRQFPDFHDIMELVKLANKQEDIEMAPVRIHQMAANAFKEFGEMLKRLRQYDDYDIIISYLDHQLDPARDNQELQEQLNKNAIQFKKKEQEVIDKFAAQDAGLDLDKNSESHSKPKKKQKIIIETDKKSSKSKQSFLSSESSEDTSNGEDSVSNDNVKSISTLLDSDDSSEEGSNKIKDKGKTLMGKKKIIKRGSKLKQSLQSQRMIGSDNGQEKDPKDTFTSYLGLDSTPKKRKNVAVKSHLAKNQISCKEKSKSLVFVDNTNKSDTDTSGSSKSVNGKRKQSDSSTDLEQPVLHKKESSMLTKTKGGVKEKTLKTCDKSNPKSCTEKLASKPSVRISLSSDSENESAERTSADESEFSAKRSESVSSKAPSLDLSSDSEPSNKDNKLSDNTIILSEDMPESAYNLLSTKCAKDSDSDNDILILSQSSTEVTVAASSRSKDVGEVKVRKQVQPTNTISVPQKKQPILTSIKHTPSTPNKSFSTSIGKNPLMTSTSLIKPQSQKRRGSDQIASRINKIARKDGHPQMINGAARKLPPCKPANNSDTIPLIELD